MSISQLAKQLQQLGPVQAKKILREVQAQVKAQSRAAGLKRERERLVQRLRQLDAEIARAGGGSPARSGRKRERNKLTIVERAIQVLSKIPEGMRITDLAKSIRAAGHKTMSEHRTFVTAVYLAIQRDPRIRRVSKGVYAIKAQAMKLIEGKAGEPGA